MFFTSRLKFPNAKPSGYTPNVVQRSSLNNIIDYKVDGKLETPADKRYCGTVYLYLYCDPRYFSLPDYLLNDNIARQRVTLQCDNTGQYEPLRVTPDATKGS